MAQPSAFSRRATAATRRVQSAVSSVELLPSGARERVELRPARVLGLSPLGVEPAGALEPLERGEERTGLTLKTPREICSMRRAMPKPCMGWRLSVLRDQHVQRALNDVGGRLVHSGSRSEIVVEPYRSSS